MYETSRKGIHLFIFVILCISRYIVDLEASYIIQIRSLEASICREYHLKIGTGSHLPVASSYLNIIISLLGLNYLYASPCSGHDNTKFLSNFPV